jgi:hypothetical protein
MRVEELFASHAVALRRAAGDRAAPNVRRTWEAFLSAARGPVPALQERLNEDLLMVDITTGGAAYSEPPVILDLSRRVGLTDETGDYLGSWVLRCRMYYGEEAERSPAVRDGVVVSGDGCLGPPELPPTVDEFAGKAEQSAAFRALLDEFSATGLDVFEGPG